MSESESKTSVVEQKSEAGRSILIIDDEESLLCALKIQLSMHGYKIHTMTNPLEALVLLRNQPEQFDLIICDETMPGMSGTELVTEILPLAPNLPMILCSGFWMMEEKNKLKLLGVKKILEKPIEISELLFAIKQLLIS